MVFTRSKQSWLQTVVYTLFTLLVVSTAHGCNLEKPGFRKALLGWEWDQKKRVNWKTPWWIPAHLPFQISPASFLLPLWPLWCGGMGLSYCRLPPTLCLRRNLISVFGLLLTPWPPRLPDAGNATNGARYEHFLGHTAGTAPLGANGIENEGVELGLVTGLWLSLFSGSGHTEHNVRNTCP